MNESFEAKNCRDKYSTEISNDLRVILKKVYNCNPDLPASLHTHFNADNGAYRADDAFYLELKKFSWLNNTAKKKFMSTQKVTPQEIRQSIKRITTGDGPQLFPKKKPKAKPKSKKAHLIQFHDELFPPNKGEYITNGKMRELEAKLREIKEEETKQSINANIQEEKYKELITNVDIVSNIISKEAINLKEVNIKHRSYSPIRKVLLKQSSERYNNIVKSMKMLSKNEKSRNFDRPSTTGNTTREYTPLSQIRMPQRTYIIRKAKAAPRSTKQAHSMIKYASSRELSKPKYAFNDSSYISKLHSKYLNLLASDMSSGEAFLSSEPTTSIMPTTQASSPSIGKKDKYKNIYDKL